MRVKAICWGNNFIYKQLCWGLLVSSTSAATTTHKSDIAFKTLNHASHLKPIFSMVTNGAIMLTDINDTVNKNIGNSRPLRGNRI